ncbi:MAG TPA: ATP synthase F0 subunit B [Terracidiphilus sp.]|nr:ATP synthase F0 subunit B [Terracidiphilus sp.]
MGAFRLVLLLAVVVLWSAPSRAAAQQSATGAPAASAPANGATSGSGAAQPAPAKSDDEGDAQFLHSPVVQSVARMLHLKLDTAVAILLGINFAIIFFAVAIPLTRAMPKIIRKRSQSLSQDLSDARQATSEAQARLSAVEAQLAGLGEEIKKLSAQVEQESREDEKRIKASLGEESARIVAAAEQEINTAVTQAKRGLRSFAADLAIGQAEKQISLTPETDRALIAEFVAGVAGDAAGKGGNN